MWNKKISVFSYRYDGFGWYQKEKKKKNTKKSTKKKKKMMAKKKKNEWMNESLMVMNWAHFVDLFQFSPETG